MILLVIGGVRSGKSRYGETCALRLAETEAKPRLYYFATAEVRDDDPGMTARIARHQANRDKRFTTIDMTQGLGDFSIRIQRLPADSILLIDGMGLWLSLMLERHMDWRRKITDTITAIQHGTHQAIFVSDEVGSGILPPNRLARAFIDNLGELNQTLAQTADTVVQCVAGIPVVIKGEAGDL